VQVRPTIRTAVSFRRLNLADSVWPLKASFDAIFCRNVLIYFDRATQTRVVDRLASHLRPGGYLFLGHSEGFCSLNPDCERVGNTVYRFAQQSATPLHAARNLGQEAHEIVRVSMGLVETGGSQTCLSTTLGSCVSACLYDPEAHVGGMNHFLVAEGRTAAPSARFGQHAMPALLAAVLKRGANRATLRAKAFGGAAGTSSSGAADVARGNVEFVRQFLHAEGIPLVAESLGGSAAREIRFFPDNGRARVRSVSVPGDPDAASIAELGGGAR
jgi:chemotaxis receptor (MCP) glutamine deamidase CheD